MMPTIAEPRANRAGQPFAVASEGMNIQTSSSTPTTPMVAPTARSQRASPPSSVGARCATTPTPRPAACPSVGHEEEEEDGNRHAIVGTRPAERRHDPRHVVNADDQPDGDTAPHEDATDEAEAPATDTREDQGDDEKSVERVHAGRSAPDRGTPTACPLDRHTASTARGVLQVSSRSIHLWTVGGCQSANASSNCSGSSATSSIARCCGRKKPSATA